MAKKLTNRVKFDLIRYANCWEDADILLKALKPENGDKILSIGSAGDNSFSLLLNNPQCVVAVDINKVQLYLIELKKAAFSFLSYSNLLSFLGITPAANRFEMYQQFRHFLPIEVRQYWDTQEEVIHSGVIYKGKFEKYFKVFSTVILPLIHSPKIISELTRVKTLQAQEEFYHKHWNNWRWRLLFKVFFSKAIMGNFGRDPEFLKQVDLHVGDFIFNKTENHLTSQFVQHNPFAYFIMHGHFGDYLPHYLRPENYEVIKMNLPKLQIFEGYAEEAIDRFGKFNCMNLSDIFEYVEPHVFKKIADGLLAGAEPGARLGYWNLMVNRRISTLFPQRVQYLAEESVEFSRQDNGFFYNQFILEKCL